MTSIEPPLAVIAASADFENLAALTVNFLVNSPLLLYHLQKRSIDQGLQVRIL